MGKLLVYALSIFSETVAAGGTSFEQWKAAFKREYGSKREETKRRGVFESNMRRIDSHNALMHRSFSMAVNQFADLTTEEWRAQVLMPSRHLGATLRSGGDRKKQAAAAAAATTTLLPEALDWAADGYVTPVKNQQACGSCWAFSSTGVVESAWAIKQNLTGPSAVPSLSEQQILDCTSGEDWEMMGCGGGDMKVALRYMQQAQLSSEAYYPYQSVDVYHDGFSCGLVSHSADPLAAPQWGITSIADVDADDAALQTSLAASPVSVGLCAGSEWQFYSSGVLSGECCTDIGE
jgi:C1A family cysteine protease